MDNLDYLTLIKFAVENIYNIKNVGEITSQFKKSIEDITDKDERQVELETMNIPGHEYYLFKFKENKDCFGEFSLDFIPRNPEEFAKNEMLKLGGAPVILFDDKKQLGNFRIQLFSNDILAFVKLRLKTKIVSDYIISKFGKPNQSTISKESANFLKENHGIKIDCWHFQKDGRDYLITLYFFEGRNLRPYISFSTAIMFKNKG